MIQAFARITRLGEVNLATQPEVLLKKLTCGSLLLMALLAGMALPAWSQSFLTLPEASQRARVTQRIGVSDVTIVYHRPLVNGRKLWGGLVPYGQVWRAGANENTTIEFSDPVSIEGSPLAAGIYGLHMIPGEKEWTVIFSRAATSWGSFSYDQAEDALRVQAHARPSEMHEALVYDFDDLKPDSALLTMRWGELAVPFKVGVDVNTITTAKLRSQLRGGIQYSWEGWDEAANYILNAKGSAEDALKYSNQSIQVEQRFDNLMTRARAQQALGRSSEAAASRDQAMQIGSAMQVHSYGRQLMMSGHQAEGFNVFGNNIKKYPDSWIVHSEIARLAVAQGDFDTAVMQMKLCLAGAPPSVKPQLEGLVKRLENREDINK